MIKGLKPHCRVHIDASMRALNTVLQVILAKKEGRERWLLLFFPPWSVVCLNR